MLGDILVVIGAVALLEGLVLALAPLRFEELLAWLRGLDPGTRRMLGLLIVTTGLIFIWAGRMLAG
ncbi:MAG: DUF2065 family protein [Rhodobacteraceae bacterium]|nr:DUF2065 family protein [Paracoccaceae bacterium]